MNEKFNKNAEVEKLTTILGIAVRLIVIDPCKHTTSGGYIRLLSSNKCAFPVKHKCSHVHLYTYDIYVRRSV